MSYKEIDSKVPFYSPANWEAVRDQVSPRGKDLTATYRVPVSEHGYVYFLNATTEFTTTLPGIADAGPGWTCKFVVKAAPSGANYVITEDGAIDTNKVISLVNELETDTGTDGPSSISGHTFVNFIDGVAGKGDYCVFECDGTNWYCHGEVVADGGITLT